MEQFNTDIQKYEKLFGKKIIIVYKKIGHFGYYYDCINKDYDIDDEENIFIKIKNIFIKKYDKYSTIYWVEKEHINIIKYLIEKDYRDCLI